MDERGAFQDEGGYLMRTSLAEIARNIGAYRDTSSATNVVNILTFVEDWCGVKLFPVQRVIIKAHYGLELDDVPEGFTEELLSTYSDADLLLLAREENPEIDKPGKDGKPRTPTKAEMVRTIMRRNIVIYDDDAPWRKRPSSAKWLSEREYLHYLYDNGRSNIREVAPGIERRELILSIGRRSGKCVEGDTLVLTGDGIQRIEDMGDRHGPETQPFKVEVAQEGSRRSTSSHFYNGGVKETRRITTRCGYYIAGTPNHRVRVMREDGTIQWRFLEDIEPGDYIGIHRGTNLWSSTQVDCTPYHNERGRTDVEFPDRLDEDWGRLLGYLVGDGHWPIPNYVGLTVEHPETWDEAGSLMGHLMGETPKRYMDERTANTGSLRNNSVAWRDFLHDLGWSKDCDRYSKYVPWSILQSPEPVVRAFLRGLFETEGGIEKDGQVVSFSTASARLGREVQVLLTNLGIVSRLKSKWNPEHQRFYYIVTVRGLRSRQTFADKIGFDSQKKMGPLLASLESAGREGGDSESIPHQRAWTRRLLESVPKAKPGQGWSRSTLRTALGNTVKPSSTEELTYSRLRDALRVAQELGADAEVIEHFESILEADYYFDPVVEVEEAEAHVFDLCVPDGVSFVANGMTNHNTHISACIAAYETYRTLLKGDPQLYYGLPPGEDIQLISVATDTTQAGILYNKVKGLFNACDFFSAYRANSTQTFARFQTPKDIDMFGRWDEDGKQASINVTFRSCIAKGLRGAGNLVAILDEVAHFTNAGQSSAEEIYQAISPSLSALTPKDPDDLTIPLSDISEGRMILISSPLGRQGKFFELFQFAMKGGPSTANMLAIQAPTWEVNPTIPAGEFEKEYAKDSNKFLTEYGGQFSSRTLGWIEVHSDLLACVQPDLRPRSRGLPRTPHFMGIDFALAGDGTAIAIGHIEADKVVLDLIEERRIGLGQYVNHERLDYEEVADWVLDLSRRFLIEEGMFDQWAGIIFEQALQKRGLQQIKSEHFTRPKASQIFKNFKDLMYEHRLMLYDDMPDQDKTGLSEESFREAMEAAEAGEAKQQGPISYLQELLELQATVKSKYVIEVEAPKVMGKHDDRSDALVRMVWLAAQKLGNIGYIAGQSRPLGGSAAQRDAAAVRARLAARAGGTHEQRQVRIRGRRIGRTRGGRLKG